MRLRLVAPTIDKEAEFVSMLEEFRAVGEAHFVDEDILVNQGFKAYISWL